MAEDFLPMLRSANIFPRRRNVDRPFGMVDVDSGSVTQMLHRGITAADAMKNKDLQRQKELMYFQNNLAKRGQQPQMQPQAGMRPNVNVVQGGFSPMQQRFREEDALAKANDMRSRESALERGGRLHQALAEGSQRNEGEMNRLAAQINSNERLGAETRRSAERMGHAGTQSAERVNQWDNLSRERVAADQLRAQVAEREAARTEAGMTRQFTAGENERNRTATAANTRAVVGGRQQVAETTGPSAAAQSAAYNQRVQDFLIQNPQFTDNLPFDDDAGIYRPNFSNLSPDEVAQIQGSLIAGGRQSGGQFQVGQKRRSKSNPNLIQTWDGKEWK